MERLISEVSGEITGNTSRTPQKTDSVDFENLGWYPGWLEGKTPPYWKKLEKEVLRRDRCMCQFCNQKTTLDNRVIHHIDPKEEGGTDSIRNLATLHATPCHDIAHYLRDLRSPFDSSVIARTVLSLRARGIFVDWKNIGELILGFHTTQDRFSYRRKREGNITLDNQQDSQINKMPCSSCGKSQEVSKNITRVFCSDCIDKANPVKGKTSIRPRKVHSQRKDIITKEIAHSLMNLSLLSLKGDQLKARQEIHKLRWRADVILCYEASMKTKTPWLFLGDWIRNNFNSIIIRDHNVVVNEPTSSLVVFTSGWLRYRRNKSHDLSKISDQFFYFYNQEKIKRENESKK